MTTTLTPPTAGSPEPAGPPPTRGSSRVVAIIVVVFGALVILGTIFSAIVSTIGAASVHTTTRTADASGVSDLDVDVAAGSLRIEFTDVSKAELEVTSTWGADHWTLSSRGGTLRVASPQGVFGQGWPFGGWPFGLNDVGDATLRLPQSLEGTDADLRLAAGELVVVDGSFGQLGLDMGAGQARIAASVDDITADVSAGSAELDLQGAHSANLQVSAGSLEAQLSGRQPDSLELEVSAGTLDVTVPAGDYHVTSDVSAGDFDNRVGSVPGADSTVTVQVSAGKAILRAG
jgi:hypothetical protein